MKRASYHYILIAGTIAAAFLTSYVDAAAPHSLSSQDGAIMERVQDLIGQQYGAAMKRFFTALQTAHKITPATATTAFNLSNALQSGNPFPIDESRCLGDRILSDKLLSDNNKVLILSYFRKTLAHRQDVMLAMKIISDQQLSNNHIKDASYQDLESSITAFQMLMMTEAPEDRGP